MPKIKITQKRSTIDYPKRQRLTLEALGIRRINQTAVHEDTPQIRGMIEKVRHLVEVSETES